MPYSHFNRGSSLNHGTIIRPYYSSMTKYDLINKTIFFVNNSLIDYAQQVIK